MVVSSSSYSRDWLFLVLAFVIVLAAAAEASKNGGNNKRVGFKKNVNTANQWACKNPQPRLVYISIYI